MARWCSVDPSHPSRPAERRLLPRLPADGHKFRYSALPTALPGPTMKPTTLLPLLLIACSDYSFAPEGKPSADSEDDSGDPLDGSSDGGDGGADGGDGGGTTDPDDPTLCEEFTEPGLADVEINTSCEVEYSEGTFTPVTEWIHGNSSFCGPPAAGVIVDSDRDGDLDDADMPGLCVCGIKLLAAARAAVRTPSSSPSSSSSSIESCASEAAAGAASVVEVTVTGSMTAATGCSATGDCQPQAVQLQGAEAPDAFSLSLAL